MLCQYFLKIKLIKNDLRLEKLETLFKEIQDTFQNSNSLLMLSGKQVHEESVEIGNIENCIKEHLNNIIKISEPLPMLCGEQIDKESLDYCQMR